MKKVNHELKPEPTILVVEDNDEILHNVELLLKFNGYQPITATNGKNGLEVLSKLDKPPNLIISDIMMPEMDGYGFFQKVSENPEWSTIPFIFLSAKTDPQEIRFSKKLGIDDYITKPFEEEDLLAVVAGKINRAARTRLIAKQIEEKLLTSLKLNVTRSLSQTKKEDVLLLLLVWDESFGPQLNTFYPKDVEIPFDIQNIGMQLFQAVVSVYGQKTPQEAEGISLRIMNIKRDGFIYFDTRNNDKIRGGKQQLMLASIAPRINYLESLRIKETFGDYMAHIKREKDWDIQKCWETISDMLVTTPLNLF